VDGLRILLSTEYFAGVGGTESYTLTVARELGRLGHQATIYSPQQGEMARLARAEGFQVLDLASLPRSQDLLICSDAATCHELAGRYPDAVTVFVAHSADYTLQAPPNWTVDARRSLFSTTAYAGPSRLAAGTRRSSGCVSR
jgi:hypothetical protein